MTALPLVALVQVSMVTGAALLAATCLRRRSAATRHWVLVAGLWSAIAVVPMSEVSSYWLPASWRATGLGQVSRPGVATSVALDSDARSDDVRAPRDTIDSVWVVSSMAGKAATVDELRTPTLAVWAVGSLLAFAVLFAGLVRLTRVTSQSTPVTEGVWPRLAREFARRSGLSGPVRLVQTRHPTLLATWGFRRPVILLPAGAESWTPDRIRVVLAHELAHVARRDWVTLLFASALRAIFWFNPLLWMASRRLRIESEMACDDHVLALGADGAHYASHLLELARLLRTQSDHGLLVTPITASSHLQERIQAMLLPSRDRRTVSSLVRGTTLIVALALTMMVAAAGAQSSFYSLTGVVRDSTNRVLPAARLVMTNLDSQSTYEVRSNADGRYEFVGLPPASYKFDVDVMGFAPFSTGLVMSAAAVRDIPLQVASLEETITVRDTEPAAPDAATLQKVSLQFEAIRTRVLEGCARLSRNALVGGNIMPPRKLLHVVPVYAQSLRDAGVGGVVTMTVTIGTDGLVRDVEDLNGPHAELASAAEQAVRQWQFSQTWLNCEAIEVKMRVTTNFVPQ